MSTLDRQSTKPATTSDHPGRALRTRRTILVAAAAAAGGAAVQAIARPDRVAAADVSLGAVNTATAATTIQTTEATSTAVALSGVVLHTGSGPSTAGVHGRSDARNGIGVQGIASRGAGARGVTGRSVGGTGVSGEATSPSAETSGVKGVSASSIGKGVFGLATATSGLNYGVFGQTDSPGGRGVHGLATAAAGGSAGVTGRSHSNTGKGVYGFASSPTGTGYGVLGQSSSDGGYGVVGLATSSTGATFGVYGSSYATAGTGVVGATLAGVGVYGRSNEAGGRGVLGWASGSGTNYGVFGQTSSPMGYAGYFFGRAHVNGNLSVLGSISKGGGGFLIDHPLDPASRYLEHSFVEAPERLNVYRGTVTLDGTGRATVRLPRYFGALNVDVSYQLTALGVAAPGLHVARGVSTRGTSFRIAGGAPNQDVCWQVTATRQDAWARANRLRVERRKPRAERGRFLHPQALGRPRSSAIHRAPRITRLPRPQPSDASE
jgi:hypothetical protein